MTVPSRCFLLSLSLAAALGTTPSRGANPTAGAPLPLERTAADSADASPYAPELEPFVRAFKPGGQDFAGQGAPLPPEEARRRLVAREGYTVDLVASEPRVRQPLDLHFDERGRLWVVQYLQYPFPAGSKIT